jgi:hypothetical protein
MPLYEKLDSERSNGGLAASIPRKILRKETKDAKIFCFSPWRFCVRPIFKASSKTADAQKARPAGKRAWLKQEVKNENSVIVRQLRC